MSYDNIRGLFAIPGAFFNVDIGGWGVSPRTVNAESTMDARYISIARNRIRRLIKLKTPYEDLQDFTRIFMGGYVSMLNTPHGSMVHVVSPAGILWIDQPPVYVIDPDHPLSIYTTILNGTNDFYKGARKAFLR